MAATIELGSRQPTEETVSPLRLKTGATRMKDISVVPFPPFSVAWNRVMAPLLMSYSFQPAVAAVAPGVISRGPRRSTAAVTTATVPLGVRSSNTTTVVVVIVRHYRGGDGTALWPPQQHGPRPFFSFGWEQRGACRDGPPVNGLANSIAQEQAQRDVEMDGHGGPVSKVSGRPETTAPLARGGPLYRHATGKGCNHQAGPSHRQPLLSRTRPLRSGSNRTKWRCRYSPCRRGSGSSHRTSLHHLGGRPGRQ